ncbi:hypothetical protein HMPREF6745_1601 [Prevotella sp. oral taxon 472 str. F0295]|nr:hypothetical protein HMPREF6745_1601 [Prevotella sp. oral taxon 472 str. F0295]
MECLYIKCDCSDSEWRGRGRSHHFVMLHAQEGFLYNIWLQIY